ncbi:hypothetical protein BDV32DRAFT_115667 [Aspergillus pseudonomiae]|nr:hypothetical protein BDV32DRAFT_115667 [Aspergillus pseudonomiae]
MDGHSLIEHWLDITVHMYNAQAYLTLPLVRSTVPDNLCSRIPMRVSNGLRRLSMLIMCSSNHFLFSSLSFSHFFLFSFFFLFYLCYPLF